MPQQPWPDGGPWMLATTSSAIGWQLPAAALAAAATVRVAVLAFGTEPAAQAEPTPAEPTETITPTVPGELLLGGLATYLEAREGGADPLTVDEAAELVRTLSRTHGLVLVVGVPGLLVPLGPAGWTLTDLAAAVNAPVLVVTGPGPDSANHTTLALGALTGRNLTAAVVTVSLGADRLLLDEALPVTPAGHIPADAAEHPGDFPVAAREWLEPMLHASAGRRRTTEPPPPPQPVPPRATSSGRRVVLLLGGVFLTMVLVVCGLAFCGRTREPEREIPTGFAATVAEVPEEEPVPTPRRSAGDVCPPAREPVRPTRPDSATTARVNAAWQRIEKWLAVHVPKDRRSLRPPASRAALDDLQKRLSVPFPPDLVASLLRHDGVASAGFELPWFYEPASVREIGDERQMLCEVLADGPSELGDYWWHAAYVPFATSGDGGNLLVDQRPGGHGRVGEFFNEEGVDFEGWPASVAELLEKTATSLETGRPYDNRYRPVIEDGSLTWDII
ncbi:SMI1/KNR4 family protein [Actinoplanes sp. NPDC049548]|uniref:SMI1/KNR4 family protein n=1 Tax=Actinoplanes sp. NPDC049548 TaxID=3155152 RepID=UPI00343166BE